MRGVLIAAALVPLACSKGPTDLVPTQEPGRFASRADVEKLFAERAEMSSSNHPVITGTKSGFKVLPLEYDGALICERIEWRGGVKFKGSMAGLWVKGDMLGAVDGGASDCEFRFSGAVTGPITVGGGVVWFEKLPDTKSKFLLTINGPRTIVVVSSATREELKALKLKFFGKGVEIVAFECDLEPGRYAASLAEWGSEGSGVHALTVFSKRDP